jgi:hypothetical protein
MSLCVDQINDLSLSKRKAIIVGMQPIAAILIREISDNTLQGARARDPVSRQPAPPAPERPRTRGPRRGGPVFARLLASRG